MIVHLGKTSTKRMHTCRPECQEILLMAAMSERNPFDWGVVSGYRDEFEQNQAFDDGNSLAQWGKSPHNIKIGDKPYSEAFDICRYSPEIRDFLYEDRASDVLLKNHMCETAHELGYILEWGGGYWKYDGNHFQLIQKRY